MVYSAIKRWNLAIWENMDGPRGYYAKWNKTCDFTFLWNLKKNPKENEQAKQKQMKKEENYLLEDTL